MKSILCIIALLLASCAAGGEDTTDTLIDTPPVDQTSEEDTTTDLEEESDSVEEPTGCTGNEDCDDTFDCTTDICGVDGTCRHIADNDLCEEGQRCTLTSGCTEHDCDDNIDCVDGIFCNGNETCYDSLCWDGEEKDCDDGNECTRDSCNAEADKCVYEPISGCISDASTDGELPDPFDPLVHYDGMFYIAPTLSSECPGGTYSVSQISFDRGDSFMTIQVGSFPLQQAPPPEGVSFLALYEKPNCGIFQLQGNFYNAEEFSGTWHATFTGGGCSLCSNQEFEVYGFRL